ncbi:MAG: hypothetical protein ACRCVV_10385 [Shewanella sp.]
MPTNIHTDTLERLTRKFGNLFLHISGESKVSFLGLKGNSWNGFITTCFDGDLGCMERIEDERPSALDNAFQFMRDLTITPHLNLDENSKYTLTEEEWDSELDQFLEFIESNPFNKTYQHYVCRKGETNKIETVITIQLKPLCNTYVIGEYQASNEAEFVGEVTAVKSKGGYDTLIFSRDKFAFLLETTNDKHLYTNENSIKYREFIPTKGDYLLRDNGTGKLVILPKNDYVGYYH